ncbi:tubulin epsilon and delta complex protein 2 isoform X2 [Petromyzon marinus]|uniref:Tubulin epsilon and delta complex protein 2 isoform X2 n=1 Tax=Petromyzon marinus TaxID=7757 RepID=A0AAJ7TSH8_PETMA|nr:tubulin epsilon and delta complex protein 2 isoform X2 [Petromyzon marinus]
MSCRVVDLLLQAMEDCLREQTQLEQEIVAYRQILQPRVNVTEECEPTRISAGGDVQEAAKPSAQEMEDLELLNKALAKALKVRESGRNFLKELDSAGSVGTNDQAPQVDGFYVQDKRGPAPPRKHQAVKEKSRARGPPTTAAASTRATSATKAAPRASSLSRRRVDSCGAERPPSTQAARARTSSASRAPAVDSRVPKVAAVDKQGKRSSAPGGRKSAATAATAVTAGASHVSNAKGLRASTAHTAGMGAAFPEDEPTGAGSAAVLDGPPACSREADEFTARHKGSNLEFPEKWKRQQAKNHRLWQKVGLLQGSCTPEEEAYALKLRSTFLDGGVAALSRHDVAQRLEEVDLVASSMDHLLWKEMEGRAADESLGWEALCKRTKLLEECQLLISRLQEEVAQLQQVAERWSATGHRLQVPSAGLPHGRPGTRFAEQLMRPVVTYSSAEELKEMASMQHDMAWLQLLQRVQQAIADEFLPFLSTLDPARPPFPAVYRAVYSILCEGAEAFPSLVRDASL